MKTLWDEMIDFIGFIRPRNNHFSRTELIDYLKSRRNIKYTTTIDNYRNYLTQAGYLETIKPGLYKIKAIPMLKSMMDIKEKAYPDYRLRQSDLKRQSRICY